MKASTKYYSNSEERLNIIIHFVAFLLSILGFFFLIIKAYRFGNILTVISFGVFGISLITLYASSALYHSAINPIIRARLRVLDHSAIYILIAGSYTPLVLITLKSVLGRIIFFVVWGIALAGISLKFFFVGRFAVLSTIIYVLMGWLMVIAIKPLMLNLPREGLIWMLAGGISYTVGALLYALHKIKYGHAIFHLLAVTGSFCHFIAIYFFVL